MPDDELGGYTATSYLIEHGHRRIGYLREANTYPADSERFAGYQRALSEHGVDFDDELVVVDKNDPFGGPPPLRACFGSGSRRPPSSASPTAWPWAPTAPSAVPVCRFPDDISVIGFDNQDQIAPWLDPPLTTMQLPHEAMGRWAVEHLLRVLSGEVEGPQQRRMECPLVVRDSVAPPRNGAGVPPRPKRGTS